MVQDLQEPYQVLINNIQQTEARLNEDAPILDEKIDINSPDWEQIAMRKMEIFGERNKPHILHCANLLAKEFPLIGNKQARDYILQEIRQTTILKNHLTIYTHCNTEVNFSKTVTLFILTDLGVDSRDWILALKDCTKEALRYNIEVKKILSTLLFLANDADHHGMGSAKDFIRDMIRE